MLEVVELAALELVTTPPPLEVLDATDELDEDAAAEELAVLEAPVLLVGVVEAAAEVDVAEAE